MNRLTLVMFGSVLNTVDGMRNAAENVICFIFNVLLLVKKFDSKL